MGSHNKSIRQALEEAKRFRRNALSQVDADSKDHEQDRQTDAAYPVSSFRESVQRTLCTLFCLFQLGYPCISRESSTNQKHQTDPDHHKHFSNQNLTMASANRPFRIIVNERTLECRDDYGIYSSMIFSHHASMFCATSAQSICCAGSSAMVWLNSLALPTALVFAGRVEKTSAHSP